MASRLWCGESVEYVGIVSIKTNVLFGSDKQVAHESVPVIARQDLCTQTVEAIYAWLYLR